MSEKAKKYLVRAMAIFISAIFIVPAVLYTVSFFAAQ